MTPISLDFQFAVEDEKKHNLFQRQKLLVEKEIFNAPQYSLFWNSKIENSPENTYWNQHYTVKNQSLPEEFNFLVPF